MQEMAWAMILVIGGPLCAGAATYTWSVCGHSLSFSQLSWFLLVFLGAFVCFCPILFVASSLIFQHHYLRTGRQSKSMSTT